MSRSKRANFLKQSLKRTTFSYVNSLEDENITHLSEWNRFSAQSNLFLEDVKQQYDDRFTIGRTDLRYPCLAYDLHVEEECHTREESFQKTLGTAIGIACWMKFHKIFKIILIPGKGRYVLKKDLHSIFKLSTEFCVRTMVDNAGTVVLKQIKNK
ncbi:unnamed protein product [Caenorhabditis nigoni]